MRLTLTLIIPLLFTWFKATSSGQSMELSTNIKIEASLTASIKKGTPCFIAYSDDDSKAILEQSGALDPVISTLKKRGYQITNDPGSAALFVKIDFAQSEPVETPVTITKRPTPDYSNSIGAKNLAATTGDARYKVVSQTTERHMDMVGEPILGPDGSVIILKGEESFASYDDSDASQQTTLLMYPLDFQIAAWEFEKVAEQPTPRNRWMVRAYYKNYRVENLDTQLKDISEAASRYIGKQLKKPRVVKR